MTQTSQQVSREAVLSAKYAAHVASKSNPALTADERAELAELLEVAV